MAQQVEQRTFNPWSPGSSPGGRSSLRSRWGNCRGGGMADTLRSGRSGPSGRAGSTPASGTTLRSVDGIELRRPWLRGQSSGLLLRRSRVRILAGAPRNFTFSSGYSSSGRAPGFQPDGGRFESGYPLHDFRAVSSAGRAPVPQTGGRWFDPSTAYQTSGPVAQWEQHGVCNAADPGSNPGGSTTTFLRRAHGMCLLVS